jgi:hypothetical protein
MFVRSKQIQFFTESRPVSYFQEIVSRDKRFPAVKGFYFFLEVDHVVNHFFIWKKTDCIKMIPPQLIRLLLITAPENLGLSPQISFYSWKKTLKRAIPLEIGQFSARRPESYRRTFLQALVKPLSGSYFWVYCTFLTSRSHFLLMTYLPRISL